MIKLKNLMSEGFHHLHKEYILYEGDDNIVAIFEDNSRLKFEVHFRNKHGEDRNKHRKSAFNKWKSLANEIHRDVQLTEQGNPLQKTWRESFKIAMRDPSMKEFIRTKEHRGVYELPFPKGKGFSQKL